MNILVKRTHEDAIIPTRAFPTDAGLDLVSVEEVDIPAGERRIVDTGVAVDMTEGKTNTGVVGLVCSRSGLAAKHGIAVLNAPGIIDAQYRGSIKVILVNHSNETYRVSVGDKIAQLLVTSVSLPTCVPVDTLDETDRSAGGLGSTGK